MVRPYSPCAYQGGIIHFQSGYAAFPLPQFLRRALYAKRYERAFGFYCDRAAVVKGKNWGHIDSNGALVYPLQYAWTGNYQENLCVVRDFYNNYFHIDLSGNRIYNMNFQYAGDFKDGYACVKSNNGWKHIDKSGKDLNGKYFLDLGVFHKGIASAKDETGWFHINKNGEPLYSQRYLAVEPFYIGFALVTTAENQKEIINEDGKVIHSLSDPHQHSINSTSNPIKNA